MTFTEFIKKAEERFEIKLYLEKSKAGHEMMILYMEADGKQQLLCYGDITGPDAGYACHFGEDYCLTIFGWAYALDRNTLEWYLVKDGVHG